MSSSAAKNRTSKERITKDALKDGTLDERPQESSGQATGKQEIRLFHATGIRWDGLSPA
jgi:hypothetical protein